MIYIYIYIHTSHMIMFKVSMNVEPQEVHDFGQFLVKKGSPRAFLTSSKVTSLNWARFSWEQLPKNSLVWSKGMQGPCFHHLPSLPVDSVDKTCACIPKDVPGHSVTTSTKQHVCALPTAWTAVQVNGRDVSQMDFEVAWSLQLENLKLEFYGISIRGGVPKSMPL